MRIRSAKDLTVYKRAYELALRIFEMSKRFPADERFALTSQIRRSSRSICLNPREARAKRRYEAAFVAKLTDCDGENSETGSALDFALDCGYLAREDHTALTALAAEIGKMLGAMIQKPQKFRDQRSDL
jgi:four helix bundle protein